VAPRCQRGRIGRTVDGRIAGHRTPEVHGRGAPAKVSAGWGIDDVFLGKFDGKWKITKIMWQSHSPKT
jgi:hypothetical protein